MKKTPRYSEASESSAGSAGSPTGGTMKSVADKNLSAAELRALVRNVSSASRDARLAREHADKLAAAHNEAHRLLWAALTDAGLVGKRVVIGDLIVDTTTGDRVAFYEATHLDEVAA